MIVSHSQDKHKNPLTSAQKIRYLKHVHPQGKFEGSSSSQPHVFAHLAKMHQQGHTHVTMVAGSDRVGEFHKLINKYNGKKGSHGYYKFKSLKVVSAGAVIQTLRVSLVSVALKCDLTHPTMTTNLLNQDFTPKPHTERQRSYSTQQERGWG